MLYVAWGNPTQDGKSKNELIAIIAFTGRSLSSLENSSYNTFLLKK